MKDLSTRIRQARRKSQLTQTGVAELLGINRSAVAQWERPGGSKPTATNLSRLALATHVGFEWLATGRGRMSPKPDGDGAGEALRLDYFAHDEVEERVLIGLRKLEYSQTVAIAELVESLVRGSLKSSARGRKTKR